jgi:capsid assembly protease
MESADGGASHDARRYQHVLGAITRSAWAILPDTLETIKAIVAMRAAGETFTPEEIRERVGAREAHREPFLVEAARGSGGQRGAGMVAVLPLYGVIIPRATMLSEMSGGTSLERFSAQLQAAVDNPDVGSILIDIDSPGGSVSLVAETAEKIREAASRKPVYAIANALMASAAYHLGSQATELIASPSSLVGSIGVFTVHDDLSAAAAKAGVKRTYIAAGKKKVWGNPFEPLSEEAHAEIQALVDEAYEMFVADVAKGRGVSKSDVRNGFGEGGVVSARKAVALGMADRVATFEQTLGRLVRGVGTSGPPYGSIPIDAQPSAKDIAEKLRVELALVNGREVKPEKNDDTDVVVEENPADEPVSLLPGAERLLARAAFRQSIKATPKKED